MFEYEQDGETYYTVLHKKDFTFLAEVLQGWVELDISCRSNTMGLRYLGEAYIPKEVAWEFVKEYINEHGIPEEKGEQDGNND